MRKNHISRWTTVCIILMGCLFFHAAQRVSLAEDNRIVFEPIFDKNQTSNFPIKEKVRLSVKLDIPATKINDLDLFFKVYDFWGNEVTSKQEAVLKRFDASLGCGLVLDIDRLGWYYVEFELYENGKKRGLFNKNLPSQKPQIAFSIIPHPIDLPGEGKLGICEHFLDERGAALLKKSGIKWVRTDVLWHIIQKDELVSDWSRMDNMIKLAKKYRLNILPIVDYGVRWASTAPNGETDDNKIHYLPEAAATRKFLNSLISRYKDFIRFWEIWNEPNIHFLLSSKEEYARFIKIAYEEIKSIDKNAGVLMGGISGAPVDWIEMLNQGGALSYFDIYNVHPYFYPAIPEDSLLGCLSQFLKAANSLQPKPLWITEIGIPTNELSLEQQAAFLIRSCVISFSLGVEKFFWYELTDNHVSIQDKEANFGILYSDFCPKPAFMAYVILGKLLEGASFENRLNFGSDTVFAYSFLRKDNKKKVLILWTTKDKEPLIVKTEGKKAVVKDMMGAVTVEETNRDSLEILLSPYPVYVEMGD